MVCTAAGLYTTIANVYRTHAALRSNCGVAMTSRRKGGGGGSRFPNVSARTATCIVPLNIPDLHAASSHVRRHRIAVCAAANRF